MMLRHFLIASSTRCSHRTVKNSVPVRGCGRFLERQVADLYRLFQARSLPMGPGRLCGLVAHFGHATSWSHSRWRPAWPLLSTQPP